MTILSEADKDLEILGRAGSGLNAAIYKGKQISLNRYVAIKIIHSEMAKVADAVEHAKALVAAGSHPNIVTTYMVSTIEDPSSKALVDVVVMEWLDGVHLGLRWSDAAFTIQEIQVLANGILAGMEHLHSRGIPHGDLHAGNIMWTPVGPRLIDLDHSSLQSLARATTTSKQLQLQSDVQNVAFTIIHSLKRAQVNQDIVAIAETKLRIAKSLQEIRTLTYEVLSQPGLQNASPIEPKPPGPLAAAVEAIHSGGRTRELYTQKYMEWLFDQFDGLCPDLRAASNDSKDELLVSAIDKSADLVADFAHLAESVVMVGPASVGHELYRAFPRLLSKYDTPVGFSGVFNDSDFDFYKFIGHDLIVSLVSMFIRNDRFDFLAEVLDQPLFVENAHRSGLVNEATFSQHVGLLDFRNQRLKLNRLCVQADMLKARHSSPTMMPIVSFEQFLEADLFLAVRNRKWRPWSSVFLTRAPRFVMMSKLTRYAESLLRPLKLADTRELKHRLESTRDDIASLWRSGWVEPLQGFDLDQIASQ